MDVWKVFRARRFMLGRCKINSMQCYKMKFGKANIYYEYSKLGVVLDDTDKNKFLGCLMQHFMIRD